MTTLYDLRDYQQEDLDWLDTSKIAQILNPMGMGKTREAVERDKRIREKVYPNTTGYGQTLVVCPNSARRGWLAHFNDYQPDLRVAVFDNAIRDQFLRTLGHPKFDVLIVPWQVLRLPSRNANSRRSWAQGEFYPAITARKLNFIHVIADEAHRAKNMKAQQTRVLKKITCDYKTAVTGTPMANMPWDWFSLLNWLDPREFSSYWKFYDRYVDFDIIKRGYRDFRKPVGAKNEKKLWKIIRNYTVCQPITRMDLKERIYQTVEVDLSPQQRKIYDQMSDNMVAWLGEQEDTPLVAQVVIAKLQRLQQFAIANAEITDGGVKLSDPSSKIDAVIELIEDNPGEQFVVYSQFRGACELLAARLTAKNIPTGLYYGGTSQASRDQIVESFSGKRLRVFVATIGAGGEAIDGLQNHCNRVIFIDRGWTPAANDQAEGRIYRQGQSRPVHVIDIVAVNTVDKGRIESVELKRQWIEKMLRR